MHFDIWISPKENKYLCYCVGSWGANDNVSCYESANTQITLLIIVTYCEQLLGVNYWKEVWNELEWSISTWKCVI